MAGPVVLIGTGTSVGKTYVAERLLRALAAERHTAVGYKPVESGYTPDGTSDIAKLERASTFHVKPSLRSWTFSAPIAPHLAARMEGTTIPLEAIRAEILRACASEAEIVLVELPGGAFSPLSENVCCAEFVRSLPGVRAILVASDRLGVLHDIGATTRACAGLGLPLSGIILSAPAEADWATGHNMAELRGVTSVPVVASLPRTGADMPPSTSDPIFGVARLFRR